MDRLWQDLRDARRSLRQRPGYVVAVSVTLALGIGANTAVFTLVDAVLLRPLPIVEPHRVVGIFNARPGATETAYYGLDGGLSYSTFRALERGVRSLSALGGYIDVEVGVEAGRGVRQITVSAVSGGYFRVLGFQPAAGRFIAPADDRKGDAQQVAVLSDGFWALEFQRDPAILGRTVRLGGTPFTIVGVAPPRFRGTRLASPPQLWVPLTTITSLRAGGIWNGPLGQRMLGDHPLGWVVTIGRLAEGVAIEQASTELRQSKAEGRIAPPVSVPGIAPPDERTLVVFPAAEASTLGDRRSLVTFVAMLAAVVGLTLIIACMNVANLVFVRASERARELAVRRALGASRVRLVWMLFAENLLLSAGSAVGGVAVGVVVMRLLGTFALPGEIAIDHLGLGLDARVLAIATVLAMAVAILIGVLPAIRASSPESDVLLRARGAGSHRPPPRLLIAGQVALTMVLLVGALLFTRSLRAGLTSDLGFEPAPLSAVTVDLFRYGYTSARAGTYYAEAAARAAALPGVSGVALATHVPLRTIGRLTYDAPANPGTAANPIPAGYAMVSRDYFGVMGIPFVAGRTFGDADGRGQPRAAILNESASRALFGGTSPLGQEVRVFSERPATVIGVVRDAKTESVRDGGVPVVYEHVLAELPTGGVSIIARSAQPEITLRALREAVAGVDPAVALHDARLIADQVDRALMTQRFGAMLLGAFAIIGVCVAAVGIYSIAMFTVSQRTAELGIRVALGATGRDVLRVVLARTGLSVMAGGLLGCLAAVPAGRALERFLYQVQPADGLSFLTAAAVLLAAAVAAIVPPAGRAVRTDPLIALRQD
jgi:predicted permease